MAGLRFRIYLGLCFDLAHRESVAGGGQGRGGGGGRDRDVGLRVVHEQQQL